MGFIATDLHKYASWILESVHLTLTDTIKNYMMQHTCIDIITEFKMNLICKLMNIV